METLIQIINHFPNYFGFVLKEEYHKWHSHYIDREFEMLVFGHTGFPVIVFPTSKARYYQAKDFGLINSVEHLINQGKIKVYCPDSIDDFSWYNKRLHPVDRAKTQVAYEKVILNDVIGFINHKTGFDKVAVAGCSFGGYHAANTAFKYPGKVSYLFSMGGASNIKRFLDGYYDETCYFNNPPDYLFNLNDDWYLNQIKNMGIILGTGNLDFCFEENRILSATLSQKQIPHWFDAKPDVGHDWLWWKQMFAEYLNKIDV